MAYIYIFITCYFIGHINPAIIISKQLKGLDIRTINSKNAGTSNVSMTIGYRWGFFVLFLDLLKGLIPVLIIRHYYPANDVLWFTGGLGAILGHVYPIFYKFKGGKGSATFGGVMFATVPVYATYLLVAYALVLFITDYIALSTLMAITITPFALYLQDMNYISIGLMTIFSIISFKKHWINYMRILHKKEVGIRKFNQHKDKIRVK